MHRVAYLLAFFTILSQILALIRERLFAHFLGAGLQYDIYAAAFRIPDLIFVSSASLVSLSVLIPLLAGKLQDGLADARRFISETFTFFLFFIVGVSIAAFLLLPAIAPFVFPGFYGDREALGELTSITRIMLLQPIALGVSGLFSSIVQLKRRFFLYSISPLLYNIGIIFGIAVLYPAIGLPGVAYGVVLGALMHLAMQIPLVVKSGLFPRLLLPGKVALRKVLTLSLPRSFALSAQQLAFLALTAFASLGGEGAISTLTYAFILQSVPVSVIAVSYATAAFPALSELFARGGREEAVYQTIKTLRHTIFWSVLAAVLMFVFGGKIVGLVLHSGVFNTKAVEATADALKFFSISLPAQSIVLILLRSFYASGRTFAPVLASATSAVLTAAFGYAVYAFDAALYTEARSGGNTGALMALAYSVGAILNAILLTTLFLREHSRNFTVLIKKSFSA